MATTSRPNFPFRQALVLEVPSDEPFAVDGVATDPDVVTLRIRKPDGSIETHTSGSLDHPSAGVYSFLYLPAVSGPYVFGFDGTGAVEAASVGEFYVEDDLLS
jgi:hypothetical protein